MNLLNWALVALYTLAALVGAAHALFNKREPSVALGWIAVCLMFPFAGPLLYFFFGINRVKTRAKQLDPGARLQVSYDELGDQQIAFPLNPPLASDLNEIAQTSSALTRLPLTENNRIELLHNGEQAYPAMLEAIEHARQRIFLTTYIFDTNATGRCFIDALSRAATRGVDVKILIDGIGELYSFPRASKLLAKRGVLAVRFLPPQLLPPAVHINLRNHRKILVVDGCIGFTGGMNIGDRHLAENLGNARRVVDAHFRITGPVVAQIEQVFIADWNFVTGGHIRPTPASSAVGGEALCRTIIDGPNEDMEKLAMVLMGAISLARRRIAIMTPYFLPSREMIAALQAAALRGVEVTIILPAKNNLPFVHWATCNMLGELLRWGVRVYYQPPPFAHTKLFLVDEHYAMIGSANIDPRSLRLNFELVIEVYDPAFAQRLDAHFEALRALSRELALADMDARPLPARTRDAVAWLFSPYL